MKKAVIFGAGLVGNFLCLDLLRQNLNGSDIVFVDNDPKRWDTTQMINDTEFKILNPSAIADIQYEKIHIAVAAAQKEIYDQVITTLNVPDDKIDCSFLEEFAHGLRMKKLECRNWFLEYFAKLAYDRKITGAVAELGVFRGEFAKRINAFFPDRTIYLYDTFEGFDERDFVKEQEFYDLSRWRDVCGNFENNSVDYVMSVLPYPERAVIRKGYFPDTFAEDNVKFCFVNLDCDFYNPIKAGLQKFYPCMAGGG
jgi:hypothetical protein